MDHDIREPGMLDVTNAYLAKISELPESLETHFRLPHQDDTGAAVMNLVINHSLCIASFNADDVKVANACLLNPMKCPLSIYLHKSMFTTTFIVNRCRRLYWNYLWNHPAHVPLPSRAIEEASDALMWFHVSHVLVSSSQNVYFDTD